MIVHCFNLYFSLDDMRWSIFSHAYLPTYFFLLRHLKVFGYIFNQIACFLIEFQEFFVTLGNSPYHGLWNYSQPVVCLHIFLILSFAEQKLSILLKSSLSIIHFMNSAFVVISKKSSWHPTSCKFAPRLSSSFTALCFTFRSVIHFRKCLWRVYANMFQLFIKRQPKLNKGS